jgi:hypothetical protein
MLRLIVVYTIGRLIAWPIRRRIQAFDRACQDPRSVQDALLRSILRRQAETDFGRDHGFASIQSIDDYRRRVPIAPYEYFEPYIERVKRGQLNALVNESTLHMFALTSGTTASRKFIPVTPQYLRDYRHGWNLWGLRTLRDHRRAISLKPIVQLAGDPDEFRTEAGIPCGSISGFTTQVQKRIIRRLYCVPPETGRIKDATARMYVALLFSLPRDVGMVVTANPSSLVQLARVADQYKEALVRDLADGTLAPHWDIPTPIRQSLSIKLRRRPGAARRLERVIHRTGTLYPKDVWQRHLIGCWTGGSVGPYLRQLPTYYGDVWRRDLGLVASEGRFTIPIADDTSSGVLDVTTHYFEFIPEEEADSPKPTVLGAHEIEEGRHYFILPTTAYGLYRYHIRDLVKVTGFHRRTPLLQFLGKGSYFSNLTGEKLSEHHVTRSVDAVTKRLGVGPSTYSVAPCWDDRQPYYGLFVEEGDALTGSRGAEFLDALEASLCEHNSEYESKRASGRLGPVRLVVVRQGFWAEWDRQRLLRSGGVPEQYKHPCLVGDVHFRESVPVVGEAVGAGRSRSA